MAAGLAVAPRAGLADQTVTVFAAASTKTALDEIARAFTGPPVTPVYAGTSALARQIQHGAPADIFLSANAAWMDALQNAGLIAAGTRRDLLSNRLALIAHGRHPPQQVTAALDLPGLLGGGRLAMALVDAVPAGIYGKAALQRLGLWDRVADRVAQTDNVRAALALVQLGEAPLGVVYASDALAAEGVTTLGLFPEDSHPPILYPVAQLAGRDHARPFLDAMQAGTAIWQRHGFGVPGTA